MIKVEEFDRQFEQLYTSMVKAAFEYVSGNGDEVDVIYIFGSIEVGYFFNVFYQINDSLVGLHEVNTVSIMQYDVSTDRMFGLLRIGNGLLIQTEALFKEHEREVPTLFKMLYHTKTGEFDTQINYDIQYTGHKEKTAGSVFDEWFDEVNLDKINRNQ